MNQNILEKFVKQASAAGLNEQQINDFARKHLGVKTAEEQVDALITEILAESGIAKTAATVAYVEGVLKTAVENNCDDTQAVKFAYSVLERNKPRFPAAAQTKEASDNSISQQKTAAYAEGFMKSAQSLGFSEGQSLDLLKIKVASQGKNVKKANGPGGPGGPPQDDGGGQQLPPEVLHALMSQAQGGGMGGPGDDASAADAGAGAQMAPEGGAGGAGQQLDPQTLQILLKLLEQLQMQGGAQGAPGAAPGGPGAMAPQQ